VAPACRRARSGKSHRKHHEFRRDKAISDINDDMRELEASDTPG
jgi:hypothetical protein